MKRNREALAARRAGAEFRNVQYNALTTTQKIKVLDDRFGKGKGAVKQRAKLALTLSIEQHRKTA